MSDAVWLRMIALLRRHWRATLLLGIAAGLAASVPIAAWAVARRTDHALPAFIESAGPPSIAMFGCPDGYVMPDLGDASPAERDAAFAPCIYSDKTDDVAELLTFPEVDRATVVSFVVGELTVPGVGDVPVGVYLGQDANGPAAYGSGLLIEGRQFDPASPNEFTIGELTADQLPAGVGVGSTAIFTPLLRSQAQCASEFSCTPGGPEIPLELVGVVRTLSDLASASTTAGDLFLSPGVWAAYGAEDFFSYGQTAVIWPSDGFDADDVIAAIERRWPDRLLQFEPGVDSSVLLLPDAIDYQSRSTAVFALVTALAALIFAGQALARQGRRESRDLDVFAMLGMPRRQVAVAAFLRAVPTAAIAALVAVGASFALSPIGPIGIARGTVASGSLEFDALVSAMGGAAVFVLVLIACTAPVATAPMSRRAKSVGGIRTSVSVPVDRRLGSRLGAPAISGLRAATSARRDGAVPLATAVVGTALAIATVIAAATVTASLDDVIEQPDRYGVTWDVNVGNNGSTEDEAASFERLLEVPGIIAASGMLSGDGFSGDVDLPLVAMVPVPGLQPIDAVVVAGRVPHGPEEIALGGTSMRELGVDIGDRITFSSNDVPDLPLTAIVVGQALVYDGLDREAGIGGVVDAAWARSLAPRAAAQSIAVRIDPAADRDGTIAALADRFGGGDFVVIPEPSVGIRNLVRVRRAPWLLAAVMVLLSMGALAHALGLAVRARRLELAVLRALGFSRRQVLSSIAWQASFVASIAVVLGVPIGLVGGQWGWRTLARSVGAASPPAGVFLVGFACCLGVLLIANLVAVFPGRSAARQRPARMLRTE